MRGFLRDAARDLAFEWSGRLLLASWVAMVAVDALAWTEPKHGANMMAFGAAVGAWALALGGTVGLRWLEGRRARRHSEDWQRALEDLQKQMSASPYAAVSQALASIAAAQAAGAGFSVEVEELRSPTSPLDKSVPAEPRAEPIVGFRIWCVEDGNLRPVGVPDAACWVPGENVAEDFSWDMVWAQPGFWVLRSLELAHERADLYSSARVIGAVELYGRVVEHEFGWRAEKARVVAVAGLPSVGYGIDVYVERAQEWTVQETIMGEREEARQQFMERYPDAALYSPKGTAHPVFVLRMGTSLSCCGVERMVPLEGAEPFDVTEVGRRYGVPAFSSLEGLEAFAREMGAEG